MGKEISEAKEEENGKFLDRLKHDFVWENDEYNVPEETPIHPEISTEFPGVSTHGRRQ